jgi:hypothetical protein
MQRKPVHGQEIAHEPNSHRLVLRLGLGDEPLFEIRTGEKPWKSALSPEQPSDAITAVCPTRKLVCMILFLKLSRFPAVVASFSWALPPIPCF